MPVQAKPLKKSPAAKPAKAVTTKVDPEVFHRIKQAIKTGVTKERIMKQFKISERTYYRVKAVRYHIQYRRGIAGQNKPMPGTSVDTIEQEYKTPPKQPPYGLRPQLGVDKQPAKKSFWQRWFGR